MLFLSSMIVGGSGLGLHIVHRFAKQLEAHLDAESEIGIGSKFRVIFTNYETLDPKELERWVAKQQKWSFHRHPWHNPVMEVMETENVGDDVGNLRFFSSEMQHSGHWEANLGQESDGKSEALESEAVESAPPASTEILDIVQARKNMKRRRPLRMFPNFAGSRVLLIEVNVLMRNIVSKVLRNMNIQVVETSSPADGVAWAQASMKRSAERFQLIMGNAEVNLHVNSEVTVAKALRDAGYKGPIVALMTESSRAARQKCIDIGCNDFVVKPLEKIELLRVLYRFLEDVDDEDGDADKGLEQPARAKPSLPSVRRRRKKQRAVD